jgi:hypothetical protein
MARVRLRGDPVRMPSKNLLAIHKPDMHFCTEFLCISCRQNSGTTALSNDRADVIAECLPIRFCAQRRIICCENMRRGMAMSLALLAVLLRILTAASVHGGSIALHWGER